MRFDLVDLYALVFDPFNRENAGRGPEQLEEEFSARLSDEPPEPRRGGVRRRSLVLILSLLVLVLASAVTLTVLAHA